MATLIDRPEQAGGQHILVFNVYLSPRDGRTVCGYHSPYGVLSGNTLSYLTMDYGVPVKAALQETLRRADLNSVPFVLVQDPEELFPAQERG